MLLRYLVTFTGTKTFGLTKLHVITKEDIFKVCKKIQYFLNQKSNLEDILSNEQKNRIDQN